METLKITSRIGFELMRFELLPHWKSAGDPAIPRAEQRFSGLNVG
jgi:hypothetical protein